MIPVARRRPSLVTSLALAAGFWFVVINANHAGPAGTNRPAEFTSVDYYPAPNQLQVKLRVAGTDVQTLANGAYLIKQLRLETFSTNGQPQAVVLASECLYDINKEEANSPGKLSMQNGDGKVRIEGEGFLWRQNDAVLVVSNRVRTTIESDFKDKF